MQRIFAIHCFVSILLLKTCNSQETGTVGIGGDFENREMTYYEIPPVINATDTSAAWQEPGEKILITGTIYRSNGQPASDVILYYYQTNTNGRYLHRAEIPRSMPPNTLGQTHGYIRGWVKTDQSGRYKIFTIRPGAYPGGVEPAHIHLTIKEPNLAEEYYLDDIIFDDDKLLSTSFRKRLENRGGSGIVRLANQSGLPVGERDIFLGLNIPNHPEAATWEKGSGKNIGEDISSFIPFHAWGPDQGTRTCPVCKYGWYHGILYFVGNRPNWPEIKRWLLFLEQESAARSSYLKAYFIYGNELGYKASVREEELRKIGEELDLNYLALTYVPSFSDTESEIDVLNINADFQNTFLIYKRRRVIGKFINIEPMETNYIKIRDLLDRSVNEYFKLPAK